MLPLILGPVGSEKTADGAEGTGELGTKEETGDFEKSEIGEEGIGEADGVKTFPRVGSIEEGSGD